MIGRGLFGGADDSGVGAGVPGAQRLMDLRRDDEDENQRRRRGLFGGLRDSFSQEGLARTNRAGVTRGEMLGAMLMSLAGPQQQAQAMNMLGDARARGREDRLNADERRREAMATQQAANDQRERLIALADSFGLQGRERNLFFMSPEEVRNEFINSRMNPEPQEPNLRTLGDSIYDVSDPQNPRLVLQGERQPTERQIMDGPDGVPRYVDTGEPVFPGVEARQDPSDRRTFTDQTGRRRYEDTGDFVFPDENPENGIIIDVSPESRARIAYSVPQLIQADEQLAELEQSGATLTGGANPVDRARNTAATVTGALPDWLGGGFSERVYGTQERDAIVRASSAIESAVLPIISGAAVTESEARRQIRASLPQPGDSPETLRLKRAHRQMWADIGRAMMTGEPVRLDEVMRSANSILGEDDDERGPIVIDY